MFVNHHRSIASSPTRELVQQIHQVAIKGLCTSCNLMGSTLAYGRFFFSISSTTTNRPTTTELQSGQSVGTLSFLIANLHDFALTRRVFGKFSICYKVKQAMKATMCQLHDDLGAEC